MSDMYERKPQNLTGPGGGQEELRVKYIDNGDGTWSLAVTPMGVAAGAATSAKQDTTNLKLDDLIEAVNDIPGGWGGTTNYTTRIETDSVNSNLTYIGNAVIGTADTDSTWQIKRLDSTTGLIKLWEDGNDDFDNQWSTREAGSYS